MDKKKKQKYSNEDLNFEDLKKIQKRMQKNLEWI